MTKYTILRSYDYTYLVDEISKFTKSYKIISIQYSTNSINSNTNSYSWYTEYSVLIKYTEIK